MRWENESELALKSVSDAGKLLIGNISYGISEKDNHKDIVTEFDEASGRMIDSILSKGSKYPIVNEERLSSHPSSIKENLTYWVVDPIDGTTNFASGLQLFCTSVGLVHEQNFVAGAIYAPKTGELYFTYGDQGSYLNGKIINGSKINTLKKATIAASFSNSLKDDQLKKLQYEAFGEINEKSRSLLRLGSAALNIAYVADGRIHGAYGVSAKIWDIGASLAIAKQAGCTIFTEFISSIEINYIVGSEQVVEEIKSILVTKRILNGKY